MVLDPERKNLAAMTWKNEQFFRGLTRDFILPFQGEKSEDFNQRLKPSANVTKRVVNSFMAAMYGQEVKRDFTNEANQDLLQKILGQNFNFQIDAQRWHKRAELSGLSYVIPRWDAKRERFFVNHYSADMVFPIPEPDDPFRLRALVITFDVIDDLDGAEKRRQVHREVWTPDEFLVMRDDQVAKNEDGEELKGSHDFGGIPGSFFRAEDDHENFMPVPPATDVRKMHEQLLEMLSTFAEVFRYQSFNVLFFKNPNGTDAMVGPKKYITSFNQDSDLKSVQFQADTEALMGDIGNFMELIADLGEVPSFSLTNRKGAESGLALSIKFLPHLQAIQRRAIQFKQQEIKLWGDFMRLAKMVGAGSPNLDEEELKSTVDFSTVPIPKSIDERVSQDQFDLNTGLTSPTQLLRERNPEMTEQQAQKDIRQNLAETRELRRARGEVPEATVEEAAARGVESGRAQAAAEPPASGVEA